MSKVLIELHYLPSIAYFSVLQNSKEIWVECHEHFVKQSYRNRTLIHDANKVLPLSIPIQHTGLKIPIQEVRIDYRQKWVNDHWRAIQSSYGKAPFFDYYADLIKKAIHTEKETLFEFNRDLLTLCLKLLGANVILNFSSEYNKTLPEGFLDLRSAITPKASLKSMTWFHAKPYYQLFGKDFVPNLSILDLLFCTGPDASIIAKGSFLGIQNK